MRLPAACASGWPLRRTIGSSASQVLLAAAGSSRIPLRFIRATLAGVMGVAIRHRPAIGAECLPDISRE